MKRLQDESFGDYKLRRNIINKAIKHFNRGRTVWTSTQKLKKNEKLPIGQTYTKGVHGDFRHVTMKPSLSDLQGMTLPELKKVFRLE